MITTYCELFTHEIQPTTFKSNGSKHVTTCYIIQQNAFVLGVAHHIVDHNGNWPTMHVLMCAFKPPIKPPTPTRSYFTLPNIATKYTPLARAWRHPTFACSTYRLGRPPAPASHTKPNQYKMRSANRERDPHPLPHAKRVCMSFAELAGIIL